MGRTNRWLPIVVSVATITAAVCGADATLRTVTARDSAMVTQEVQVEGEETLTLKVLHDTVEVQEVQVPLANNYITEQQSPIAVYAAMVIALLALVGAYALRLVDFIESKRTRK
ncbi:MAG: hypothetical protein K6G04_02810 [Lachnospiraceae bacterium]|nr:hypothetical protein [Lachnospiraceae bacterium]